MYLVVLANRMLFNANYVLCYAKEKIIYRITFLVKSNIGALKTIWGTPPGEVEDFLISGMFQICTKLLNCACMTGISLNIRASQ